MAWQCGDSRTCRWFTRAAHLPDCCFPCVGAASAHVAPVGVTGGRGPRRPDDPFHHPAIVRARECIGDGTPPGIWSAGTCQSTAGPRDRDRRFTVHHQSMGRRGRARRRRGEDGPALPASVLKVFETAEKLLPELGSDADLDAAIRKRRDELRSLMEPYDAVHLLGQVSRGEMPLDADTYSESEHPGRSYVVELTAAELLTRAGRAGAREHTPAIDAHPLREIRSLAHQAVLLESFRRYRSAGAFASPEGAARGRAAMQNLMLRNPGWPWQEHTVLRGLFSQSRFSDVLKRELGFDAEDAIRCTEAPLVLLPRLMHEHMATAGAPAEAFDERHPGFAWATEALGGWQETPAEEQAVFMPVVWALNTVADSMLLTSAALAEAADVEESAAASYLDVLSQRFGQAPDEDWFAAAERVRYQPYVRVTDDAYMLTVPGNDLWALRGLFETRLKQKKAYVVHRGRWLEERAGELLVRAVSPDEQHPSVNFTFEDDEGRSISGEIDQLLRCGDTVLAVEAKSATLRPGGRRGGDALISHLRENVTKAARQGTKAREALRRQGTALLAGGERLILGEQVREVHPIVVTLDDLSSVAPVLWELEGTQVMPDGVTLPWVVTLHELEQICDLTDWPVQLIHFLRRRSRLNQLGGLTASDELDWWMHYLMYGLYFEDRDPSVRQRLLSLTDPLDAWNLWKHGEREKEAPRPTMNLDARTRAFLDLICAERPNGWVPAACTFLDTHGDARRVFWKEIERLKARARKREMTQRLTHGYETDDPFTICAAVVPAAAQERVLDALRRLVDQRRAELDFHRSLGIGVTTDSSRPYDTLIVYERAWWSTDREPDEDGQ